MNRSRSLATTASCSPFSFEVRDSAQGRCRSDEMSPSQNDQQTIQLERLHRRESKRKGRSRKVERGDDRALNAMRGGRFSVPLDLQSISSQKTVRAFVRTGGTTTRLQPAHGPCGSVTPRTPAWPSPPRPGRARSWAVRQTGSTSDPGDALWHARRRVEGPHETSDGDGVPARRQAGLDW